MNAFQQDAYRPLVDCISQHALLGEGVPGPGGGCLPGLVGWYPTPLWTEFLTNTTENITLPQTSFAGVTIFAKLMRFSYSVCLLCFFIYVSWKNM